MELFHQQGDLLVLEINIFFENSIDQYLLSEVILLFTNARILFSFGNKRCIIYQTQVYKNFFDLKNSSILKENLELARF